MKFAFCLEMLYTELRFSERLAVAKQDGIEAIEFWDWRDKNIELLIHELRRLNLRVANMCGNRKFGMVEAKEQELLLQEVRETGKLAVQLGCPNLILLVQKLDQDGGGKLPDNQVSTQEMINNIISAGKKIGNIADELELNLVIEPLNTVLDHPRYILNSSKAAFDVVQSINHPRIKILYDIYHMAMQNESVLEDIKNNLDCIGYFHVADKPGRHEPGTGEIDYAKIFATLQSMNYQGFVGFEFLPSDGNSHNAILSVLKSFPLE